MNKKMLLLFLLFCTPQVKPIGAVELFALVGFVAAVRSKPAKVVMRYAWQKYSNSQAARCAQLPLSNTTQKRVKIEGGLSARVTNPMAQAKEIFLQNWSNLAAIVASMKNRVYSPMRGLSKQIDMPNQSLNGNDFRPYSQSCNVTKIQASQVVSNASGFFPKITNNFYAVNPQEVIVNREKKKFWQGMFLGGLTTAWVLKPSDKKSDRV
ncbi:hypothetical protein A3J41_03165 [candidate division TM6 bacterium RIFCSPHIGHO2_12_FULL_38_8]|nr:MAG: hypothetical protein A3J41_03165 [candidate division TM6 bacterium RIFCSPHIGHO2_12_FULL_38_8]